jgi:hypothetical protein
MKIYAIEKIGSDYVVTVDGQRVMKLSSKRRAEQLVAEAQDLLRDAPLDVLDAISEPRERNRVAIRYACRDTQAASSKVVA